MALELERCRRWQRWAAEVMEQSPGWVRAFYTAVTSH